MADTGILFRRAIKNSFDALPPAIGEIVYATDTDEYGVVSNNTVIWRKPFQSVYNFNVQSIIERNSLVVRNGDISFVIDTNKFYKFLNSVWYEVTEINDLIVNSDYTWSSYKISTRNIDGNGQKIISHNSFVSGDKPTTSNLIIGEMFINSADGKVFLRKDDGVLAPTIIEITDSINIVNTPNGTITSITVQGALNDLDRLKAPLASPTFTGNVSGLGVSTGTSFNGITGLATVNPLMDGVVSLGISTRAAKEDHIHAIDTSRSPLAGNTSLVTTGTITTGIWNATTIAGANGGTGVANTGKTITLGGNLTTSGAFSTTITSSGTTTVTLPTTGLLVGSADTGTVTNTMLAGSIADTKLNQITTASKVSNTALTGTLVTLGSTTLGANATVSSVSGLTLVAPVLGAASATTINKVTLTAPATGSTLTIADGKTFTVNKTLTLDGADGSIVALGGNLTTSGAYSTTITSSGTTTVTLPTTGLLVGSADTGTVTNTMLSGSITDSKLNQITTASKVSNTALTGTLVTLGSTTLGANATVPTVSGLTLVAPVLGVASATTINKVTLTAPATGSTLTIADGKTLTVNKTLTLTGTDGSTISLAGNLTTSGAYSTTFISTGTTSITLPTSGTLATTDNAVFSTSITAPIVKNAFGYTTTIDGGAITGTTETAIVVGDATKVRSLELIVQCSQSTNYQISKILLLSDGTNVTLSEYGMVLNNISLSSFNTSITSGNINILVTNTSTNTTSYKIQINAINI
jgi:hypothetical protein